MRSTPLKASRARVAAAKARIKLANRRMVHVRIYEFAYWDIFSPGASEMGPMRYGVEWRTHPEGEKDARGRKRSKRLGDRKTLAKAIELAERWDTSW